MSRTRGAKNKPKVVELEGFAVNAKNFVKLQAIRLGYSTRIETLKAEIAKVDKLMVRFADWMEAEAKLIRQQWRANEESAKKGTKSAKKGTKSAKKGTSQQRKGPSLAETEKS